MDSYCLFGYPVHHSWSPFIHGLFARQAGVDMTYRLQESAPEQFRHDVLEFFFAQGGAGCNVTLPHKRAAADLVNELTSRAQRADAVNTIVRRGDQLLGENTDGVGLVTDLTRNLGLSWAAPPKFLVLGAGGAARGALGPLLELGPERFVLANRTLSRAAALAREFADLGPVEAVAFGDLDRGDASPFDLVVNATSASLSGEMPAIAARVVGPRTTCYDMAYALGDTPFTAWAHRCGAGRIAQGWGMLVEQAAVSFEAWRGVRPHTPPVLAALRERVILASANAAS